MRSYRYFSLFFAYLILGVVFLQQPALAQEAEAEAESDSSRPIRDKWAVVIGIDKFKDQTIPQLRYSAKDAKDFGQFLVEKGNFAFDHVKVLINESATENNILDVLGGNWLPRRVLPDDLVVVFVSTHGSPKEIDIAGENFLIAHDTYRDKLYASAIKLEDLGPGIQRRTRCSRVVLLLDACNSGAADVSSKGLNRNLNFDLEKLNALAGEGLVVISSSSADQKSWESKRYRNGVFTRKLIETLSTNPSTTVDKAFDQLKDEVSGEVKFDRRVLQTPVMRSKWKGADLILTAKPTRPRRVEVESEPPSEVQGDAAPEPKAQDGEPIAMATPVGDAGKTGVLSGSVTHPDKVAFVEVVPPKKYEISKSKAFGVLSQADYDAASHLPEILYREINLALKEKLGDRLMSRGDVQSGLAKFAKGSPGTAGSLAVRQASTAIGARYLITVGITRCSFSGQVMWSNAYKLNVDVVIEDGQTGKRIAAFNKSVSKSPWLGDSTQSWTDYLFEKIVPKLAFDLASDILKYL